MSVSPTLRDRVDALCQTLSLQPVTDAGLGLREALERCAAAAGVRYESVSATLELLELEVLGVSPGPAPSKKPGPAPSKKRGRDESPPRQEPRAEPKGRGGSALLAFAIKGIEEAATLYGALGVDEAADAATIKKRYRELALTVHPDKGGSASAFKILNEAKETLCDADARAAYDRGLRESRAPPPAPKRRKMSGTPTQPRADAPTRGPKTGTGPCDCRGWALWLGSKPAENPCEGGPHHDCICDLRGGASDDQCKSDDCACCCMSFAFHATGEARWGRAPGKNPCRARDHRCVCLTDATVCKSDQCMCSCMDFALSVRLGRVTGRAPGKNPCRSLGGRSHRCICGLGHAALCKSANCMCSCMDFVMERRLRGGTRINACRGHSHRCVCYFGSSKACLANHAPLEQYY